MDLGDWSNDTCFVDVKNCEKGEGGLFEIMFFSLNVLNISTLRFFLGYTLLAYVKIMSAPSGRNSRYITSLNPNYGVLVHGYQQRIL